MDEVPQRKLVAIMCADVVGYSSLMDEDEIGTLAVLKTHRTELFNPKIAQFGGRVIKWMGDGALVEFASIVSAVECSLEIQRALAEERGPIRLRIGVNLGDVIVEGDDIFGDGVNIAARLEALAEPGGICVSDMAYQNIRKKLDVSFIDFGAQKLKNIATPIRTWHWTNLDVGDSDTTPKQVAGSDERPSIAVLPFDNMSGDPEQEFFSDGIAEDIITDLSRYRSLFVIARNSSFSYKGKRVDIKQIGKELGVRYVLEGSVRKAGSQVRITAQLIDATNGHHIWAQRYDDDLDDIFQVQDTVTQSIVAALPGQLETVGLEEARRKSTEDLETYEFVLRGRNHHHRDTKNDNAKAMQFLNMALDKDSEFPEAYSWRACTVGQAIARGYREWTDELVEQALKDALRALELDENDTEAHRIMCRIRLQFKQFDQSEFHLRRALSLNPNDPRIIAQKGINLLWCGDPDKALTWIEEAMRRDPNHEESYSFDLGCALFVSERYDEAQTAFKKTGSPTYQHHAFAAACAARLGESETAMRHASDLLKAKSDFSTDAYLQMLPYKSESDLERHRQALVKAGLPE
jgi:adenylate cyclase